MRLVSIFSSESWQECKLEYFPKCRTLPLSSSVWICLNLDIQYLEHVPCEKCAATFVSDANLIGISFRLCHIICPCVVAEYNSSCLYIAHLHEMHIYLILRSLLYVLRIGSAFVSGSQIPQILRGPWREVPALWAIVQFPYTSIKSKLSYLMSV